MCKRTPSRWPLVAVLLGVLLALTASARTALAQPTDAEVNAVAGKLMCDCGSSVTVAGCGNNPDANGMKAIIRQQLSLGKSTNEILDHFASIYGECILAEPRKSGIGLAAWLTPFLALVAGSAVLGGSMWAWSRSRRTGKRPNRQEPAPSNGGRQLDEYEQRVEDDLRTFE